MVIPTPRRIAPCHFQHEKHRLGDRNQSVDRRRRSTAIATQTLAARLQNKLLNCLSQHVEVKWLGEVGLRSRFQPVLNVSLIGVSRQRSEERTGIERTNLLTQINAEAVGIQAVKEEQI